MCRCRAVRLLLIRLLTAALRRRDQPAETEVDAANSPLEYVVVSGTICVYNKGYCYYYYYYYYYKEMGMTGTLEFRGIETNVA